jgi:hypothetical protein
MKNILRRPEENHLSDAEVKNRINKKFKVTTSYNERHYVIFFYIEKLNIGA